MQIILEGPDNAGKSTLAAYLSKYLNLPLTHSGGPSKYSGEVNERTVKFNADPETRIYDRHPAISQNLYQRALQQRGELVHALHVDAFYTLRPLIIYCRNERGTDGHVLSEHSSTDYFNEVATHFQDLCSLYDKWAMQHANIVYRIGDDMEALARSLVFRTIPKMVSPNTPQRLDLWADVAAFHEKFELTYRGKPRQLPSSMQTFREHFMTEELEEYESSAFIGAKALATPVHKDGTSDEAEFVYRLELQLDALVDLIYVALGTAYLHGFNFPEAWTRVQAANMKKVRKLKADTNATVSGRAPEFDVVKPQGWEPPRHTDLVEDHAHRDRFTP